MVYEDICLSFILYNTSYEPLCIYVFSSAYLRICGSEFLLNDIEDNFRHISNYTVQKKNKRVENRKTDLSLSSMQFEEYVQDHVDSEFTWKEDMFPKIKRIVIETLKSVQDNVKHKNNCFELYGFDFLLDHELSPWLIEVNLSPACCQRTTYLKEMLETMAGGILDHIEQKITLSKRKVYQIMKPPESLPVLKMRNIENAIMNDIVESEKELSQWVLSYYNKAEMNTCSQNMAKKGTNIEIIGKKANTKEEKKLDKLYSRYMASKFIQKFYRGHMARKRVHFIKMTLSSIIFQKYIRRWLSRRELIRRRENKASTTIQTKIR